MNPVLYVWKTSSRSLPWVLIQMAINPFQFRRFPGVTFAKSLGTGRGISFTPTDADLNQWSALLVFSDENQLLILITQNMLKGGIVIQLSNCG